MFFCHYSNTYLVFAHLCTGCFWLAHLSSCWQEHVRTAFQAVVSMFTFEAITNENREMYWFATYCIVDSTHSALWTQNFNEHHLKHCNSYKSFLTRQRVQLQLRANATVSQLLPCRTALPVKAQRSLLRPAPHLK